MIRLFILFLSFCGTVFSQDPHFTQADAVPITLNPAYVGVFNGKMRVSSNHRQQWRSNFDPYITSALSIDFKVGTNRNSINSVQNPLNIGVLLMSDRAMKSAFKDDYFAAGLSYHVPIDYEGFSSLGGALFGAYSNRSINLNSLYFDSQFSSNGFNFQIPNGEAILSPLKPIYTVGAGLIYLYQNSDQGSYFDIGISAFNINQPSRSLFADSNAILPRRWSSQISYQKYISETSFICLKSIFQRQGNIQYLMTGFVYGKNFGESGKNLLGFGFWYRTKDALCPQVILEYSSFKLGVSYDVVTSQMRNAPRPLRTIELGLQWKLISPHGY